MSRNDPSSSHEDEAKARPRVLVVDDERAQADLLADLLDAEGFEAKASYDPARAAELAPLFRPHAVVSDFRMPGMSGVDLYRRVESSRPGTPFLIATAFGTLEDAVEAMRAGVTDFVTKPVDVEELIGKLRRAIRVRSLEAENVRLRREVDALRTPPQIVFESKRMQEVVSAIEQVAASRATVLIRGESGTGKELIAKLVHAKSPRRSGPFVKVDCAAIPDNLLEDELFGHVKGAFTGAAGRRRGKFEAADGGTIFLDEVGELPLHLQPKLLRVLQEREIEPLGGDETRVVDVRVVAATNRDLAAMAAAGTFREDLFYRLNVVPVVVPPLRERPEDVAPLAKFFLDRFSESGGRKTGGFTAAALAELSGRPWPGNVRELENCVERAAIFRTGDLVDVADLGSGPPGASLDRADRAAAAAVDALFGERTGLDDFERKIIGEALRRCEGNVSLAARRLGLSRRALQYRVEKMRADAASESSARARHSDDQDGEDRP